MPAVFAYSVLWFYSSVNFSVASVMTSATVSRDFIRLPFRYCITVSTHALTIKQTCTDLFSSSCENTAVFDITNILFVNIFFSFAAKIVRSEAFAAKPLGESPCNSSLVG